MKLVILTIGILVGLVALSPNHMAYACSAGSGHPEHPNVICVQEGGTTWKPAPGYVWVDPYNQKDLRARLREVGDPNLNHPNVVWNGSSWVPADGFEWSAPSDPSDFSVRLSAGAEGQATTLIVDNKTDNYLTVSIDGVYGCNTAGRTTCTIPTTVGQHNAHAIKTENGASVERNVLVGVEGHRWIISDAGPNQLTDSWGAP